MTDGFLLQIVLEHLGQDAHSIHLGINLDSGLGVFDGFLASLCMILVSEVCSLDALIYSKASSIIVHIACLYYFYFDCSPCSDSVFKIQFLARFLSVEGLTADDFLDRLEMRHSLLQL